MENMDLWVYLLTNFSPFIALVIYLLIDNKKREERMVEHLKELTELIRKDIRGNM